MNYEKQATDFLSSCGVLYEAVKAVPQVAPRWAKDGKYGIQYSIELAKLKEIPKEKQYIGSISDNLGHISKKIQFFFWDSVANKEKYAYCNGKKPSAYSVLAGVYSPSESFEDFCASFGYDEDSREAEKIWHEVEVLNTKIESIFTSEQLQALQEIQ